MSETIMAHLDACEVCQQRLQAIRDHDAQFSLSPPRTQRTRFVPYGTLMAAAAAVLLFVYTDDDAPTSQTQFVPMEPTSSTAQKRSPFDAPDTFRTKGGLNARFKVKRADKAVALRDGDTVYPGDIVNFEAAAPKKGFLMIAAVDGAGKSYLCYPQENDEYAQGFGPVQAMEALHPAMRLDDVLGREKMYAIFCDAPFKYSEAAQRIEAMHDLDERPFELPDRKCQVRSVRVTKIQRVTP